MTIKEIVIQKVAALTEAGIVSARIDTELILAHVLDKDRTWVHSHDDHELTAAQTNEFEALISRRVQREPVVHLTGVREFYGLEFEITPDVLTPRIETEQMAEWAIKYAPRGSRLIDIGTGSGAIAITIAKHRPDLIITATEVSAEALAVAKRNAKRHKVPMTFIVADLWDGITDSFDTVVTNLPYLRDDARSELMPEVRHEPAIALFGGNDGLDLYRRFLAGLPSRLATDGYLFTECDPWQHEQLITEAMAQSLTPIEQGYFILGFRRKA